MIDELFVLMLLGGLIAGVLAGLLGIGGGLIFTPLLFYVFTSHGSLDPVTWTVATSLLCTGVASASSAYRHARAGRLWAKESVWIGAMGFFGAYVGRILTTSDWYQAKAFSVFFSLILLATALSFIQRNRTPHEWKKVGAEKAIAWRHALVMGGFGGVIATMSGAAGGVLVVPLLTLWRGVSFRKATSISSLALAIISFLGVAQFAFLTTAQSGLSPYYLGFVDVGLAFPMILGSVMGSYLGVRWSDKVKGSLLQWLFAVICLGMMVRILLDAWR